MWEALQAVVGTGCPKTQRSCVVMKSQCWGASRRSPTVKRLDFSVAEVVGETIEKDGASRAKKVGQRQVSVCSRSICQSKAGQGKGTSDCAVSKARPGSLDFL